MDNFKTQSFRKIILNLGRFFSKHLTHVIILAVIVSSAWYMLNQKRWQRGNGIIYWDTISYYAYLPSAFIYKDLSLKFTDQDRHFFGDKIWYETTAEGNYVIRTSAGLAVMYSPFFFAAHIYTKFTDYPSDGYSLPYHVSLAFGAIFYLIFSLLLLRTILRRYFNEWITAITILSVSIGTNLFNYVTIESTMPHGYNFSLIVFFLWFVIKWHENPTVSKSVIIGLLVGLITLIRPTNALVILFLLLFGVTSFKELKDQILMFIKNYKHLIIIAITAFLAFFPQMLYWKMNTGSWLYNSYGQENKFFWLEPELFKGLVGFRKGWLIYTPVMIFGIAGFFFLKRKTREYVFMLPIFIIVSFYVVVSWWCWWYGGGLGMRPMVDYYGLLAISIAAFLDWMVSRRWIIMTGLALLFSYSVFQGCFHHAQYHHSGIHWDSMTWKAYKYNFWKVHYREGMEKYLITPDYVKARTERE